jgi:UDP-2,3-diacylglucosamine hydrolase
MQAAEHSLSTLSCDSAVFTSDLHLSDQTPQLLARFEAFCESVDAQWLIVMGDLFEGYCGDDDRSPCITAVERAFVALHQRGVRVALMHGNRDFMMGQAFAQRSHAVLLTDPCVMNQSVLLSHGDTWCTLDIGYQAWRASSRVPAWQAGFLAQPLSTRQAQIQAYRAQSKAAQMDITSHQTDVVDGQVLASAHQFGCNMVLHGHTHRPSDRALLSEQGTRVRKVVLGDWDQRGQNRVQCARYEHRTLSTFLA